MRGSVYGVVLAAAGLVASVEVPDLFKLDLDEDDDDAMDRKERSIGCPSGIKRHFAQLSFHEDNTCKSYHVCRDGVVTKQTCEAGQLFNEDLDRCDDEDNVQLPCGLGVQHPFVLCVKDEEFRKANLADPQWYYECKNETVTRHQCPEGQLFQGGRCGDPLPCARTVCSSKRTIHMKNENYEIIYSLCYDRTAPQALCKLPTAARGHLGKQMLRKACVCSSPPCDCTIPNATAQHRHNMKTIRPHPASSQLPPQEDADDDADDDAGDFAGGDYGDEGELFEGFIDDFGDLDDDAIQLDLTDDDIFDDPFIDGVPSTAVTYPQRGHDSGDVTPSRNKTHSSIHANYMSRSGDASPEHSSPFNPVAQPTSQLTTRGSLTSPESINEAPKGDEVSTMTEASKGDEVSTMTEASKGDEVSTMTRVIGLVPNHKSVGLRRLAAITIEAQAAPAPPEVPAEGAFIPADSETDVTRDDVYFPDGSGKIIKEERVPQKTSNHRQQPLKARSDTSPDGFPSPQPIETRSSTSTKTTTQQQEEGRSGRAIAGSVAAAGGVATAAGALFAKSLKKENDRPEMDSVFGINESSVEIDVEMGELDEIENIVL